MPKNIFSWLFIPLVPTFSLPAALWQTASRRVGDSKTDWSRLLSQSKATGAKTRRQLRVFRHLSLNRNRIFYKWRVSQHALPRFLSLCIHKYCTYRVKSSGRHGCRSQSTGISTGLTLLYTSARRTARRTARENIWKHLVTLWEPMRRVDKEAAGTTRPVYGENKHKRHCCSNILVFILYFLYFFLANAMWPKGVGFSRPTLGRVSPSKFLIRQ